MPSANNTIEHRFIVSSDGAGLDNYVKHLLFHLSFSKALPGNTLTRIIMNDPHVNLANLAFNGFLYALLAPVPHDSGPNNLKPFYFL